MEVPAMLYTCASLNPIDSHFPSLLFHLRPWTRIESKYGHLFRTSLCAIEPSLLIAQAISHSTLPEGRLGRVDLSH